MTKFRWGVVGPGGIAIRFAEAMRLSGRGEIVAVASRSQERADAFGDRFGISARYDSFAALAADPNVDVVYVATPNSEHETHTLECLRAGKHVLCEKPFAMDANQARVMVAEARARGLFLMEAIWSRFLPAYRSMVEIITEGRIGEPLQVEADFGVRMPKDPNARLFRPELGGGALLDLGLYPVQLCQMVLGAPEAIVANGVIGDTGVDEQIAAVLRHPGGRLGVATAGLRVHTSRAARISGSDGWIDLPAYMHCPRSLTVNVKAGREYTAEHIDASHEGNGMQFEIDEVHRCLTEGLTESPIMPLADTIAIAETLDAIRVQVYSTTGH
ncbi:Gfo/Idh/MocA family protein [Streptomyces fuscichromogenes]|uniref:Oxidoreductase n=1 Tax=Streptomyces fuscichromogenes TaxID=1324013 RepID=A0A917XMT4_9ACTN|nr:Gfo/Idh/MocA family oxidoreductase [Streptomyces fuscichromogenes]GGN40385.1 oxidoreductase [Streptomyces fuscichromogenes]